ncbi:MFS transporter [Pectobacterium parmentieri]|uniref:MFS transporter n=1 Tax=Pectobacterium parmentieri TaxID=1905730 RepID=UPI000EABA393|nr:MFS transporter [Pectobacterium parmentieri]AYH04852.1 MFS transporter [Pectobacterium parmentieri]AYH22376.1 MFS transporter [Pectobacterium parmentieri]MBN3178797.1 MFS transporter [Pectobacterium parmentieri]QRN31024.1 MFS transporter [Pectobacterium parmentieri]
MSTLSSETDVRTQHSPGKLLIFSMAAASGVSVANIYYNQPMLGVISESFTPNGAVSLMPTVTQLGYALGLLLLVPLGDKFDRRRLIVWQFLMLALASAFAALSTSVFSLLSASLLIGFGATAAQQIVPAAAALADVKQRGAIVGTVMSGLLSGILLSRTIAGVVAENAGWRAMFWLSVPLALAGAWTMARMLPTLPSHQTIRYSELMHSLVALWRSERTLRKATLIQALLFASFSAFWSVLALYLESGRFQMGAAAAGLFGVIGVAGIFAAPLAGRLADGVGSRPVVIAGALLTLLSWGIFIGFDSIIGLIIGVVLLDLGVQSALIANQHVIYGLGEAVRGRINTVFMGGMFLGGAVGSSIAIMAWQQGGWMMVGGLASVLAMMALLTVLMKAEKA